MPRTSIRSAVFLLLWAGCSDPQCRPGEIKIGLTCVEAHRGEDAHVEADAGTADAAEVVDALVDAETALDATDDSQTPSDARVVDAVGSTDSFDAAACQPGSFGCVQCRPESEETDCRAVKTCDASVEECLGGACDPRSFTCARVLRGTVKQCGACVSDSECVADHRCVPMTYGSDMAPFGSFCLQRAAPYCSKPYFTVIHRESASGFLADDYCGVDEVATTCPAVLLADTAKACTNDESCGVRGAICDQVASLGSRCTYSCRFGFECYEGVSCGGTNSHCGG